MKKEQEKAEICRTRKDAGLSCNGCQYGEDCEEKQWKETADGIPEDIKPGTKQAKIYGLLKDGQTAAEIIKTKEFAPESVYIVARKHFPDAITPNGKNVERMKKAKQGEDAALKAVEEFIEETSKKWEEREEEEPAPEKKEDPVEKLEKMEKVIRNAEKREELKKRAVEWLRIAIEKLEAGELVKCRTAIGYAIGLLEMEAEDED